MFSQRPAYGKFRKALFFFKHLSVFEFIQWRVAGFLKIKNKRNIYTYKFLEERFQDTSNIVSTNTYYKVEVKINESVKNVWLRKFSSDVQVYQQMFIEKEFDPIIKLFAERNFKPVYVLDGGANIGLSTIYLQTFYPTTKFALVEPNESNVNLLQKNVSENKLNVKLFNVALWYEAASLSILNDEPGDEWGFSVGKKVGNNQLHIKGVTLQSILNELDWPRIDYLKLDIEGAEEEVFKTKERFDGFLKKTNAISIEAHSKQFKKEFKVLLARDYQFVVYEFGELLIGIKEVLIS